MIKFKLSILTILCSISLEAQDWKKRHQFAKSYFGVSQYIANNLSQGNYINEDGGVQTFNKNGFITPSINIGATHFWGHADFYVSISTKDIKFGNDDIENSYRLGTFTGLRVYPLASKINTVRPYLGYKFSPFRYRQTNILNQESKLTQVKSVFDLGLGIQLPNFYFTLEYGRVIKPSFDIFISRSTQRRDNFPSSIFQLGLNYTIETTKPASKEENKEANKLFSKTNKSGLFLAVGPSSAFPLVSSEYVTELYPFLDNKSFPTIFPDFSVGYHFTKFDFITALSFRPMKQKRNSLGFLQEIERKSFNLEAYKFLFDYHGFVPYIGVGLGFENISVTELDQGTSLLKTKYNKLSPNITFGWDIRPSVKGDWWILRTNLRYFPSLRIERQSKKLSLQHLEFNFIQFVFYPQRLKKIKSDIKTTLIGVTGEKVFSQLQDTSSL